MSHVWMQAMMSGEGEELSDEAAAFIGLWHVLSCGGT